MRHQNAFAVGALIPQSLQQTASHRTGMVCCSGGCFSSLSAGMRGLGALQGGLGTFVNQTQLTGGFLGTALPPPGYVPFAR